MCQRCRRRASQRTCSPTARLSHVACQRDVRSKHTAQSNCVACEQEQHLLDTRRCLSLTSLRCVAGFHELQAAPSAPWQLKCPRTSPHPSDGACTKRRIWLVGSTSLAPHAPHMGATLVLLSWAARTRLWNGAMDSSSSVGLDAVPATVR